MKARHFITTAAACAAVAVYAAASAPGVSRIAGAFSVMTGKGEVIITPVTDNIFRVTSIPDGVTDTLEFVPSQSAILTPQASSINSSITPSEVIIASPTTTVSVDRASGRVSFTDADGSLLLCEAEGVDNSGLLKSVTFAAPAPQHFYGAGERGHRPTLEGDSLVMYNRQNYGYTGSDPRISQMGITMPYIASDLGYGVLFDDYNKALLTLGDTIRYESLTPLPLSYFFINGEGSLAGTTSAYTSLTGRQMLPPFWTLGYITSKYGYHTQDEATGVIDTLKNHGFPVDGMVLDLYWYGKETDMGRLEWNRKQWPDHRQMLSDLKEKGVNVIPISQPYINKTGALDNYNLLSSQGMLVKDAGGNTHDVTTWVGDAGMLDVSNPDTRHWLWERLRGLTAEGIAGWWGDLGEPEVHPATMLHHNGQTASQYHNVYGNEWSRLIFEGMRADFPERRPVLLMRGGTAGLQRYSVFPWTTDVSRSWGGLQPQVNLMLSSGISGLGYMSSDIGGFAVDPAHPTDPELYVRWLQMGAFTPMLRTHAQDRPEPYHYPQMEDISRRYIKMRYEWLPYNYTLAYENASAGLPLARPLNFNGENPDSRYAAISDEYLWGDNVLVAPVMTRGARSRTVIFPEGRWVDWYNPAISYAGGSSAKVKAPLDRLPLFVRAGAFIPQYTQPIENVTQYDPSRLTVRYFPDTCLSSYTLFDDNRLSPTSLEDGNYQLTTFSGRRDAGKTVLGISTNRGTYEGMPQTRILTFEIEDTRKAPTSIKLSDGTSVPRAASPAEVRDNCGWSFDAKAKRLYVTLPYQYETLEITITQ